MTCAVLANLLQQWARKYLKLTQPHFIANKPMRAHYRAFYADGVESFLLPSVFEALPAMLHLSVFLFFSGLVIFLWNFNPTISKLILSWVAGCVTLYGYITFIPTFRYNSPYNTPLSPLAWMIVTGVPFISLRVVEWVSYLLNIVLFIVSFIRLCLILLFLPILFCLFCCFDSDILDFLRVDFGIDLIRLAEARDRYRNLFFQGMQDTADKAALGLRSGLSGRALLWTFDSSHEDKELERLLSDLPYFRKSNGDKDFLGDLTRIQNEKLWSGWIGFLDRTFSSDSLLKGDKHRRAQICEDALIVDKEALGYILDSVTSEDQCAPVRSAELAPFIGRLDTGNDMDAAKLTQAIVSCVIATAQLRNAEWFTIAPNELGVEDSVLRNYAVPDQPDQPDLSLAILIHVTCQQLHHFKDSSWQPDKFRKVLQAASTFNVQDASRELQNGFCSLWNQIIEKMQNDENGDGPKIARFILRPLYHVYVDIHRGIHQRSNPTTISRFFARTYARTSEATDFGGGTLNKYSSCTTVTHLLDMTSLIPHGNRDTTLITFANIIKLPQPSSETISALTLPTTAPGASPVMSLTTEPGLAAEDVSKSELSLSKETDDLDPSSANRAHLQITTNPRFSPLPSVTDSKGADVGGSLEPKVERTGGDHTPPVSHHGDDIV